MPGNERTAKRLGYAGLVPFLAFSLGCWVTLPFVENSGAVLIAYSAVILSFMGAVHWGTAMTGGEGDRTSALVGSVIPALVAWLGLSLQPVPGLSLILIGFVALFVYERTVAKARDFPDWYVPMRARLTAVVVLCIAAALPALN